MEKKPSNVLLFFMLLHSIIIRFNQLVLSIYLAIAANYL